MRPDTTPPALEVRGLSKQFRIGGMLAAKRLHAVRDVTFSISRGEILALVGESGSGKSTTARMIARLLTPGSGEILLSGVDQLRKEPRRPTDAYRRRVQMVFQDPFSSLNPVHSIRHHLERPLQLHQAGKQLDERVIALLEMVGLKPGADIAARHPHELSGGQRQRVAFARALAVKPEIILADEPVSMLDVSIRIDILNLMDRLRHERDLTYLYITHDLASARYISTAIAVMYAGYAVEYGPVDALLTEPAHPYLQKLIRAVPDASRMRRGNNSTSRAEPPQLVDPPPGCPFAPACPAVMPRCREVMPGYTALGQGRWVRCHLHGEGTAVPEPVQE
jgi:peptide/nickel transport system ATP-binding protein